MTERKHEAAGVGRRSFLKVGLGGAALLGGLGASGRTVAASPAGGDTPGSETHEIDAIHTLVSRISNGFSIGEYRRAQQLGYDAYLNEQLAPEGIEDDEADRLFANYYTLGFTPYQQQLFYRQSVTNRSIMTAQLDEHTVCRRIVSKRQLYERMVEFWTDHFNISRLDGVTRYFVPGWDRDVIRKYAMGTFPDLLRATAHHAAMLNYLDNNTNRRGSPQENYARELMELHTVGVDRGYTQQDVVEVARCFTGWTFEPSNSVYYGQFRFSNSAHDTGAKTVLGTTIPSNQPGKTDGDTVLNILIGHRNTAEYIAEKLAIHFLRYDPPRWLVAEVAHIYLTTGGDIRAMLRFLLQKRFMPLATPKLKRPTHLLCSLLRATDSTVTVSGQSSNPIGTTTAALGHRPYTWETPDGFPDSVQAWGSSLLPRWTAATDLLDDRINWASVDPIKTIAQIPGGLQPGRQAQAINMLLANGRLPQRDVINLQMFIDQNMGTTQTLRDAIGIAASLPGFQWY